MCVDHRFSAPSHIVLENVTFGRDGQPATPGGKSVDIALSSRQLTEIHAMSIPSCWKNGTSHRPDQATVQSADRLQLRDMAFTSPNSEWKLRARAAGVNGGGSVVTRSR